MQGHSKLRDLYHQDIENTLDKDIVDCLDHNCLQELADEEGIEINWEKWNSIVEETRQAITKTVNAKQQKPKYVYSLGGKLLGVYNSTKECSDKYGISPEQINTYCRTQKPYFKGGLLFRTEPLEKPTTRAKPKYVYNLEYKLVGVYQSAAEAEKALGISREIINSYAQRDVPHIKQKLWYRNEPIKEQ